MFENALKGHYLKVVGTEEKGSSEEEVQWDDTMLHLQIEEREKREREAAAALAAGSAAGAVAGAEAGESSQKKPRRACNPRPTALARAPPSRRAGPPTRMTRMGPRRCSRSAIMELRCGAG